MVYASKGTYVMEYNNNFKYDLAIGQAEEIWLGDLLKGAKLEVKRDFKSTKTGNIYVEYECRGKPSGVSTTEADYWAFILNGERVIIVPTDFLKDLCRYYYEQGKTAKGGDGNFSMGVLLPTSKLV